MRVLAGVLAVSALGCVDPTVGGVYKPTGAGGSSTSSGAAGAGGGAGTCGNGKPDVGELCFQKAEIIPTKAILLTDLALVNCNADGNVDIATVGAGPASGHIIEILRGEGKGAFSSAGTIMLFGPASSLAATRVMGSQNDAILAVPTSGNSALVTSGELCGSPMSKSITIMVGAAPPPGYRAAPYRGVDGNGIAFGWGSALATTSDLMGIVATQLGGFSANTITARDLNDDAIDDFIMASATNSTLLVRQSSKSPMGPVSFSQIQYPFKEGSPAGVAAGDIDGDKDIDVVVAANATGNPSRLHIFTNTNAVLSVMNSVAVSQISTVSEIAMANLDNDELADVVVIGRGASKGIVQVYRGGAMPTLAQTIEIDVASLSGVKIGNVDGNGAQDILVSLNGGQGGIARILSAP